MNSNIFNELVKGAEIIADNEMTSLYIDNGVYCIDVFMYRGEQFDINDICEQIGGEWVAIELTKEQYKTLEDILIKNELEEDQEEESEYITDLYSYYGVNRCDFV